MAEDRLACGMWGRNCLNYINWYEKTHKERRQLHSHSLGPDLCKRPKESREVKMWIAGFGSCTSLLWWRASINPSTLCCLLLRCFITTTTHKWVEDRNGLRLPGIRTVGLRFGIPTNFSFQICLNIKWICKEESSWNYTQNIQLSTATISTGPVCILLKTWITTRKTQIWTQLWKHPRVWTWMVFFGFC